MNARTHGSRRLRRVLVSALCIGTLAALAAPGYAAEDESPDIPTSAVLQQGSGSTPPLIECAWALADQDNASNGYQYKAPYDDDNTVLDADGVAPSGPQDQPCYLPGPTSDPTQTDDATHMTQVRPYAHDWNAVGLETNQIQYATPTNDVGRLIRTWAAVDHNNNVVQSVYADVYHPDGTFKFQVYGTKLACTGEGADPQLTAGSAMWQSAVNTGQVAPAAVQDASGRGMINLCLQGQKDFYKIDWPISKEQMCGEYKVTVSAQSANGTATKTFYLDVLCFIHLELDFQSVNFGTINTNQSSLVTGNTTMEGGNSAFPTVRNTGNTGMQVGLRIFRMSNGDAVNPKYITSFDAKFTNDPNVAPEVFDPINVPSATPTEVWFSGTNPKTVLCANRTGKLDLSIHPDLQVPTPPAGTYTGKLVVLGNYAPNVCANDVASPNETLAPWRVDADGPQHSDDDPTGVGNVTPNLP